MYNCHNEAVQYLKDKLGTKDFNTGINTKKCPNRVISVYLVKNIIPYSDEHCVHLLLEQYYLSIQVKKELYYKLISLGVKLK